MTIFGLHIVRASTVEKERKAIAAAIEKQNTLWNKVISKLLWENHQLRLKK